MIRPDLPTPFGFDVVPTGDGVRVAPVGELDLASAGKLERTILELRGSGIHHVVLDLRGVSFLDSSGLRMILALDAIGRADSLRLELLPGPPQVQRIFELTGTLDRLPFAAPAQTRPGTP